MLRAWKAGKSCLRWVSACKDILPGLEQTRKPQGRQHPHWFSSAALCSCADLCVQLCIIPATAPLWFIFFDGLNSAYHRSSWPDVHEVFQQQLVLSDALVYMPVSTAATFSKDLSSSKAVATHCSPLIFCCHWPHTLPRPGRFIALCYPELPHRCYLNPLLPPATSVLQKPSFHLMPSKRYSSLSLLLKIETCTIWICTCQQTLACYS